MNSGLYKSIEADLKQAMIAKDQKLVNTLKMIKSAIQYGNVDLGVKASLNEEQIVAILRKELKKRLDAAQLYKQANDYEREQAEDYERRVIEKYLPKMLDDSEINRLVEEVMGDLGRPTPQTMGKIIAEVKQRAKGLADGGMIARAVKGKMNQ